MGGHHPAFGEFSQRDRGEGVLPDGDRWPVAQPEADRVQAIAVTESEGEHRMGVVERTGRAHRFAEEANRLDQLLVTVGNRRTALPSSIAELDDDRIAPVNLDVLSVGDLKQRLEAPVAEDRVLHRLCAGVFHLHRPQRLARRAQALHVVAHHATNDRPSQQAPIGLTERIEFGGSVGDQLRSLSAQGDHQRPVDDRLRCGTDEFIGSVCGCERCLIYEQTDVCQSVHRRAPTRERWAASRSASR